MLRLIQKYSNKLFLVLVSLLVVSGVCINAAHALTYTQGVGLSFTFDPSISVTLSSSDLIISNLVAGTASDSNIITVNVKTNNATGYALNATVGNNTAFNTRDLIHQTSTITDKFSSVNFGTIVATNTALSDNTWGYSYSLDNGTNWIAKSTSGTSSGYSGLPLYSDTTNIATLRNSTGPVATVDGDDIKFKIAARASNGITSGEYNNVINFTAVANPLPKTLAMAYEDAGKTKLNGYYKMQDMSSAICSTAEVVGDDSVMEVIDVRDNNVYHIAKLADNNCWMLDNLALDPTDPTTAANMSASNTNASAEAITNLLNGGNAGSNAGWSSTAVADVDTGFYSYTAPMINNASKDTVVTSYGAGSGKVGIYYNFCAASASTYCYGDGSGVDVPDTNIDAPQDICPANWRMPTGGDYDDSDQTGSGEYYALGTALGLTFDEDEWGFTGTTYQTALSTPLSGYYDYSSAANLGNWGYWWSSTYCGGNGMYNLDANSSYVNPTDYYDRSYGVTMRCLASS